MKKFDISKGFRADKSLVDQRIIEFHKELMGYLKSKTQPEDLFKFAVDFGKVMTTVLVALAVHGSNYIKCNPGYMGEDSPFADTAMFYHNMQSAYEEFIATKKIQLDEDH